MSTDPYKPLFELAGVGLAQIDPATFRFLRVNRRLCQITGYAESELLEHTPIEITYPDDWHADRPAFESLIRGDFSEHTVEKRYVRKDGSIAWVMVTLNPVRDSGGRLAHLVSVVRDIDRRVRIEADLKHRNRALAFVSDTATRLLMAADPGAEIAGIVAGLADLLETELYESHAFDPADERLHLLACCKSFEAIRGEIETVALGQYTNGSVARSRRPMVLEHALASTDPAATRVRSLGITAWVCHPLLAGGRLAGTMAFGTRRRETFEPSDLDLVRTTCDQVAMAIERHRLTDELEHRASDLSQANRAKDHFLAVLSHELRTPLTPVLLSASAMESDPSLPRPARDEMTAIRQNVELEARLIDDLLDLTRITRGKLELDLACVDVHELIHQAVRTVAGDAGDKKIIVTSDLGAANFRVHGDATRLQQILLNLLKNAIKFTPEGGTVTIRTENDGREEGGTGGPSPVPLGAGVSPVLPPRSPTLIIEVIDTGIGIPPEMLPKIFEAFEQGAPSITRRFGGLGLGLAISRALATAHIGSLTATSKGKNRGSTFTLKLPTIPSAAARPDTEEVGLPAPTAAAARPETGDPQTRLNILLVEDHPSTASTLARVLRKLGHDVSVATGVGRALDLSTRSRFDLLISDIGLPDGTGLDLVRQLRATHPGLPAIALSGYGTEDDIQRSLAAGFSQHLTKPINIEQLKALTCRANP